MKRPRRVPLLRTQAEQLAAVLPKNRLHHAVLSWANDSSARRPWAVALSGGADSLVLLLLLWAHWPQRRAKLQALHFNHRLRGAASRADAAFCRKACAELGVEFHEEEWLTSRKGASEAEARAARMSFFERRTRVLWLGHQQDDIAESMLMRLARGSGAAGLAAPRPVQPMPGGRVHLRPLLGWKKTEICAALRAAGIAWREDSSNAGRDFFRNRVRHDVLPAWCRAAERDGLAGAAWSRELLEEDDDALESWLAEIKPLAEDGALDLRRLTGKPRAVWRRALHRWLQVQREASRDLSRQAFEALLRDAMVRKSTRHSLGAKGFGVIRQGQLRFVRAGAKKKSA